MKVENLPTKSLIPYARNAKRHDDAQVAKIAGSIKEFGFNNPVLIDKENGIIAGHGRVLAAQLLELEEVPCIRLGHLSESQRRAYILADNRLAEIGGGWDEEMLELELDELTDLGVDLESLGFEIDALGTQPDSDPDGDSDPVGPAFTAPGDLLELVSPSGRRHRLLCGDSTKAADVEKLLAGRRINLLHTDPPYGVSYESETLGGLKNDDKRGNDLLNTLLLPAFKLAVEHSAEGAAFYVWHASSTREEFAWALKAAGLQERQYLIWVKPSFVLGHADYHWGHEPCFYCAKFGDRPRFIGDRKNSTIWRIGKASGGQIDIGDGVVLTDGESNLFIKPQAPKNQKRVIRVSGPVTVTAGSETDAWEIATDDKKDYIHPTQKPVSIPLKAINNHCVPGDSVLDLFSGSGSTLVASEMAGCNGFGMEMDPKFCDAIAGRWLSLYAQGRVTKNGEDVSSKFTA